MEHTLLKPRSLSLNGAGIPLDAADHLLLGSRRGDTTFHDANIRTRIGIDDDIDEINQMEQNLGVLSKEKTELRVAADLCCLWRYDYPSRVHEICEIIGGGPKGALRLHYQISPNKRQEFVDYATALNGWIKDIPPDDKNHFRPGSITTTNKVYKLLGDKDPLKVLLAERTYIALSGRFLNCSFWGTTDKEKTTDLNPHLAQRLDGNINQRLYELESIIESNMGVEASDFLCDVGGSSEPACHFKFIRRVDILVSSIGCLKWRGNLPEKDGSIRGRRKTTATFMAVLEKYWNGKSLENPDADTNRIETELFGLLGEPDDFKRWLVASLFKNIKTQTTYDAFPMNRWVEFVQVGETYLDTL